MRFTPGETIVRRYIQQDGRVGWVLAVTVVSDDDRGLLTWTSAGWATAQRHTLDNEPNRYLPVAEKLVTPSIHRPALWRGTGTLMFTAPGATHSVWWFFDANGDFERWYVNLETPGQRWPGGKDCFDQALDIWIEPDGSWQWKDEDEFADYLGRPGFWDDDQAAAIRAEGESVIKRAQSREFPFDGTWCDFTPDPSWKPTRLPWWWDQVPDQSPAVRPEFRVEESALTCEASTSRRNLARSGPRGAATDSLPPRSVHDSHV
ncbi:MAG: DUF402 domain-containing protein [Stackebrandtia sp.]